MRKITNHRDIDWCIIQSRHRKLHHLGIHSKSFRLFFRFFSRLVLVDVVSARFVWFVFFFFKFSFTIADDDDTFTRCSLQSLQFFHFAGRTKRSRATTKKSKWKLATVMVFAYKSKSNKPREMVNKEGIPRKTNKNYMRCNIFFFTGFDLKLLHITKHKKAKNRQN